MGAPGGQGNGSLSSFFVSLACYSSDETWSKFVVFLCAVGYYMYIEASAPRRAGDRASLISSKYLRPINDACVTFWYHMLGTNVGNLVVSVREQGEATAR